MSKTAEIRAQFPILERTVDGKPLVFMDHGASTHAPQPVLDAVMDLHTKSYANIHRGLHTLSQESSDLFDDASKTFANFIGARDGSFVMGGNTTDSLTLAAHLMGHEKGATLTTLLEHHSNDLPHRAAGDVLHAGVDEQGRLDMLHMEELLVKNDVKLVAVSGCSNVTGYFPPIYDIARMAHDNGAKILVDAAQLYAHDKIDVKPEGHPEHIDMLAAAGHKAYAPFGSSFLYASDDLIDNAQPYKPGGGTVDWVTDDSALFTSGHDRHMGGTPNITGVVAFAAATKWLQSMGMEYVREHELELLHDGTKRFDALADEHNVKLLGPKNPQEKAGVFSFYLDDVHHDIVSHVLSKKFGVATRNGCFCAHPLLHKLLGLGDTSYWTDAIQAGEEVPLPGASRATIGIYNQASDLEILEAGIRAICEGERAGQMPPMEHVEVS